jgi:hypothetical protein
MTVAADPDPYPKLYGAPAYGKAPRAVPDVERPLDPDDLPLTVVQTDEERALASILQASGTYRPDGDGLYPTGAVQESVPGRNGSSGSIGARRFSLHALTDRLGARGK